MKKYSCTIRVDRGFRLMELETKPFLAKDEESARRLSEARGRKNYLDAIAVDCINVEVE